MYTIIEDCSPYYIRFTHPGIEQVIAKCIEYTKNVDFTKWHTHYRGFTHYKHPQNEVDKILSLVPLTSQLNLNMNRAAEFVTQPGRYYWAHKDGVATRVSINYTVKILDDKCVTSWYSDEDLKDYKIAGLDDPTGTSRECVGFDKKRHTPLKTMTAQPGECILFNTDIYHDFDNSQSTNERMVLTLRLLNYDTEYFDDVKNKLFGI